ncbi:hypothetical protein [Rhodanobacter sp. C05]|uniref:hypothetical protein n=1 Tax=Rhodanobacter sp. C05 TaxID=1945855 RepID=UPI00117A6F47|nr:hypothetical protein [Rhodanobacter sp. C05]
MTFKFRKTGLIYVCVFAIICAFLAIIGIRQSGFNEDNLVFIFGVVFNIVLAFIDRVICMDLVVNDNGISRIFFGRSVLFLKWSDIKVIKDVVRKGLSAEPARSFFIIPRDGVSLSFWSSGWIRFPASMHDFRVFVDVMNTQVRSHDIRIERIRGIDIVMCDGILVSDSIRGW